MTMLLKRQSVETELCVFRKWLVHGVVCCGKGLQKRIPKKRYLPIIKILRTYYLYNLPKLLFVKRNVAVSLSLCGLSGGVVTFVGKCAQQ